MSNDKKKKALPPPSPPNEDQAAKEYPGLFIDQALYSESALLCLYGWSPSPARSIARLTLMAPGVRLELAERLHRLPRPDLLNAFPALQGDDFGLFAALAVTPRQLHGACLRLETCYGETTTVELKLRAVEWVESVRLMRSLGTPVLSNLSALIESLRIQEGSAEAVQRLTRLATEWMETHHAALPLIIVEPAKYGFFAVDRAWALGKGSLLMMGWRFDPYRLGMRIHLHTPSGQSLDLTNQLFPLPRPDVAEAYRDQFLDIPEETGWISHARLPTAPGEVRLLELRPAQGPSCWVRVPDTRNALTGSALVREILHWIPQPQRMRRRLHALFDDHLGPAFNAIAPTAPPGVERIESITFGLPVAAPRVSVLVPLYGRYDFLRHQLAHFADDPDFQAVDLLYLVDDPKIWVDTLDLATTVQPLFGIPFRVVHAGANLGYAAINNLGVRLARADRLLLLNSDVIPFHPGWLGTLLEALERLPNAGAVAPLLLFPEGAVQHAGMTVGEHPIFPGFLFNRHPGKGQPWSGSDTSLERAMLTAACLLLRTADYRACGGMDEGYRVGDFEDSDLCLALRQRGLRLYLAPETTLCHLERQSQQLTDLGDLRMLLTLYNAWRFGDKIRAGQLPDPRRIMEG